MLQAIHPDGVAEIGGLPWLPYQTMTKIGISSLTSKILCERHNSELSKLDAEAGRLFRTLDAADKETKILPPVTSFTGKLMERWFIKVLCGLAASGALKQNAVPHEWKRLLVGGSWPAKWGLYVPQPPDKIVLAKEFFVETAIHPTTNEVKAARFRLAGVPFNLILGRPDDPQACGVHRPRGLIFKNPAEDERRVEFKWSGRPSDRAIIFHRMGTNLTDPPQWAGWNKANQKA